MATLLRGWNGHLASLLLLLSTGGNPRATTIPVRCQQYQEPGRDWPASSVEYLSIKLNANLPLPIFLGVGKPFAEVLLHYSVREQILCSLRPFEAQVLGMVRLFFAAGMYGSSQILLVAFTKHRRKCSAALLQKYTPRLEWWAWAMETLQGWSLVIVFYPTSGISSMWITSPSPALWLWSYTCQTHCWAPQGTKFAFALLLMSTQMQPDPRAEHSWCPAQQVLVAPKSPPKSMWDCL